MNKAYWYKNGVVFVKDTKGKVRNVVYSPNLKQILLQENLIETIENEIKKLQKKNKKFEERYKSDWDVLLDVYAPMIALFLGYFIILLDSIVTFNFLKLFSLPFILPFVGISVVYALLTIKRKKAYLKRCHKVSGRECQISFLEKQMEEEKTKLDEMQQLKAYFVGIKIRITKINTRISMKKVYENYSFYYNCGFLASDFYDHYQENNCLPEHLTEYYTDSQIKEIEEYIQKEGPRLSKRLH